MAETSAKKRSKKRTPLQKLDSTTLINCKAWFMAGYSIKDISERFDLPIAVINKYSSSEDWPMMRAEFIEDMANNVIDEARPNIKDIAEAQLRERRIANKFLERVETKIAISSTSVSMVKDLSVIFKNAMERLYRSYMVPAELDAFPDEPANNDNMRDEVTKAMRKLERKKAEYLSDAS